MSTDSCTAALASPP